MDMRVTVTALLLFSLPHPSTLLLLLLLLLLLRVAVSSEQTAWSKRRMGNDVSSLRQRLRGTFTIFLTELSLPSRSLHTNQICTALRVFVHIYVNFLLQLNPSIHREADSAHVWRLWLNRHKHTYARDVWGEIACNLEMAPFLLGWSVEVTEVHQSIIVDPVSRGVCWEAKKTLPVTVFLFNCRREQVFSSMFRIHFVDCRPQIVYACCAARVELPATESDVLWFAFVHDCTMNCHKHDMCSGLVFRVGKDKGRGGTNQQGR